MVWHLDLLSTISRVLVLRNGESPLPEIFLLFPWLFFCLSFVSILTFLVWVYIYRRTVVSVPCGPSALAVKEAAWGLARYAAISQVSKICLLCFWCLLSKLKLCTFFNAALNLISKKKCCINFIKSIQHP